MSISLTKIDQLVGAYLNREEMLDPTRTITFLHCAEQLEAPFSPATVEYAAELILVWTPPWLRGIDWDYDENGGVIPVASSDLTGGIACKWWES